MENNEDSSLIPTNLSFEDLKKINQHGVEYWSARELQSLLGYSKWQRFENAVEKAIESCKQSGNNPNHHFTGAGNPIMNGKGRTQVIIEQN
jgi:DNA-damage-inducible protein D